MVDKKTKFLRLVDDKSDKPPTMEEMEAQLLAEMQKAIPNSGPRVIGQVAVRVNLDDTPSDAERERKARAISRQMENRQKL